METASNEKSVTKAEAKARVVVEAARRVVDALALPPEVPVEAMENAVDLALRHLCDVVGLEEAPSDLVTVEALLEKANSSRAMYRVLVPTGVHPRTVLGCWEAFTMMLASETETFTPETIQLFRSTLERFNDQLMLPTMKGGVA